jgi:hypothetical protein
MKKCSKCREAKPLSDFSTDNSKDDKKYAYCKPCANTYKRVKQFKITEHRWNDLRVKLCKEKIEYWTQELRKVENGKERICTDSSSVGETNI